jgi:opacity protein-like surface antigen
MKNITRSDSVNIKNPFMKILMIGALMLASTAQAEIDLDKPLYVGLAFSSNNITLPVGTKISGDETTRLSADDSALAWKILLGMNYSPKLDLALTYQNIGSYEHRITTVFADKQLEGRVNTDLDYKALTLELRPKYRIGKAFNVQALLGLAYIQAERSPKVRVIGGQDPDELEELQNDLNAAFKNETDNELGLIYGVTFSYHWSEKYALGYELNYSAHGDQDISMQQIVLTRKIK